MIKTYLWQELGFPHFHHNPVVVNYLEEGFRVEVLDLERILGKRNSEFEDVITEKIMANSEIEGVSKDLVHDKMTEFIEWLNRVTTQEEECFRGSFRRWLYVVDFLEVPYCP